MKNIADDGNFFTRDAPNFRGWKKHQVAPVLDVREFIPRIDNICFDVFCQKMRSTYARVPHHDHVDLHRQNIVDSIEQRFSF
jgi:hypothetical protein